VVVYIAYADYEFSVKQTRRQCSDLPLSDLIISFIVGMCILLCVLTNHKSKPSFATIRKYALLCGLHKRPSSSDVIQNIKKKVTIRYFLLDILYYMIIT
jgi:hypothetical protein